MVSMPTPMTCYCPAGMLLCPCCMTAAPRCCQLLLVSSSQGILHCPLHLLLVKAWLHSSCGTTHHLLIATPCSHITCCLTSCCWLVRLTLHLLQEAQQLLLLLPALLLLAGLCCSPLRAGPVCCILPAEAP